MKGKWPEKELQARNERRQAIKKELEAQNDSLTGLFNRQAWDKFAADEVNAGKVQGLAHHILSIDLDGLRLVNETSGQAVGDRMIQAAASMIRESVRDSDFVARWGGDEFAAILLDSPTETAMMIKARIHKKLGEVGITASIGVESTSGHDSFDQAWSAVHQKTSLEKPASVPRPLP